MTYEAQQQAEFDLLMQSQFWPSERLRDLQLERLEKLLRHAQAHAPFYATRLDILFRPDGGIDWERWGDLPIVKRDDLQQHRRAMLARVVPDGHEQIGDVSSSGSTGRPVTTSHSQLALRLSKAAVFRANTNDKVDFGQTLGAWNGERANVAPWPDGRTRGTWGPPWDSRTSSGLTYEINHTVPAARALEFMARHGARYLLMGGTDARLFAYEAQRLGIDLPLDGIFTRGTDPTPYGTQLVREVFGARALPLYSSKEGHRMAHRCPDCGAWHVNDEQVVLEILDADNRPVPPGQSGQVVITPLWGYAQPLIRYEQGDIATRGEPATCDRGLSTVTQIVGRVRHMFIMPDGSRVVPTLTVPAVVALNAMIFQVAQVALDRVEIRYVPKSQSTTNAEPAIAELAVQFPAEINVTLRALKSFDVPPGRKHIEYVCEIKQPS